jgi:hypothetical protein
MPTPAEHQAKIKHNQDFVSFLEASSNPFQDWVIIGLYYIAVHQVERHLATKAGQHCYTHQSRTNWMTRLSDFKPIWGDYRDLEYMSRTARYESVTMTVDDIKDAKSWLENIERRIEEMK